MVLPFFPLNMYRENEKGKAHVHTRARPQANGKNQKEWDTFEQIICFTLWWDVWYTIQEKLCNSSVNICRGSKYSPSRKSKVRKEIKLFEWTNKLITTLKLKKMKTNNYKEWPLLQLDGKLSIFLKRRWKMKNGGERGSVACRTLNHNYLGCRIIFKI